MSYIKTLKPESVSNMEKIYKAFREKQFNLISAVAVLCVLSKESGFRPVREKGYGNTPLARIRKIFRTKLAKYSDSWIERNKKNNEAFFEVLYGNSNGNKEYGDGWKYRGGGFNQSTFKNVFNLLKKKTGIDFVKNPELIEYFDNAVQACIADMENRIEKCPADLMTEYKIKNAKQFKNLDDAVNYFYHANAGWGRTLEYIKNDHTGGRAKALSRSKEILEYCEKL